MRRITLFLALLSVLSLGDAGRSEAQTDNAAADKSTSAIIQIALRNLERAKCGSQSPCAPATPAEFANPPITASEARSVLSRGGLSGVAAVCRLDWQRQNFLPMMQYWRNERNKNERQMAIIGLLHGMAQGIAESRSKCSDEGRREVQAKLAFKP